MRQTHYTIAGEGDSLAQISGGLVSASGIHDALWRDEHQCSAFVEKRILHGHELAVDPRAFMLFVPTAGSTSAKSRCDIIGSRHCGIVMDWYDRNLDRNNQ